MTDHRPSARPFRRLRPVLALFAALLGHSAAAATPDQLPPVDEVFVLSAQAADAGRISVQWKIADGYYLYRHRTAVQADAGFSAGALQLPKGKAYRDEFFGDVETYRGSLLATLPGTANADRTTLTIKYQGCADVGICYPPQTRRITVALPAAQKAPVVAFGNVGTGSAPVGLGVLGNTGAVDALPLPPEQAYGFEAIAGDGNTLLLRFTPARGYYLYRDNTRLTLDAGATQAGLRLGTPRWPQGTPHEDGYFGRTTVYFNQIDVPVPVVRTRADAVDLRLTATFQGCQNDGICYPPMTRTVAVSLPRGTVTPPSATVAVQPTPGDSGQPPVADATDAVASATGERDSLSAGTDAALPATAPPQTASAPAAGTPDAALPGAERSLWTVLVFALLGGLILNLMPCVLPVLSLKALSLAGNGQDPVRARRHALWYTAGVMLSFAALGVVALALRQAGLALGWGFQLQQPLVIAVLALVMFGLGLSMSGVWHVGGRWTGAGHALTTRSGPMGDFFTGVLAVVVATPCTAPFMGVALAWAFAAPSGAALAVFLALGLGLALPFLLIGFIPALAKRLPRPGEWMETFKQALAFPMYLTAAWLAWVLARQRGADAVGWWLLAAVLLAFAAWAWTRSRRTGHRWATAAALLGMLALAWPLHTIHGLPRPAAQVAPAGPIDGISAVPYGEQRLADLRAADRVVFVNVTADWCVTCKANEKTVFKGEGFRSAMEAANAVYMVGDWTDVDPTLTTFLQQYKAVGVPLYVVFPRGGGEGRVLPTVLTEAIVDRALREAAGGHS
ncbi:protein-disulfide reductase DsbD domain-containing protein [Aerolutibacter ruishenii]|uniref:Thiol:disulfide interchange protein DsbD n=1 Tax=Aerolutibacter ruishenii TaxID=686800 RepID=A0A562LRS8_9GAMM|nr:protein-disulfide reductase DsbD domain-containing protein [Lysobacter ruishenii]TWI10337.1 thiol:disulfide interchange protein DsbD [Lysobacter ruishenii]